MKVPEKTWADRLWLAFVLLLWLLPLLARAGTMLAQTNSLALQWIYPSASVSPDLGFVLYGTTNLAVPQTNWPAIATVMATNQTVFGGVTYPATNGALTTFSWSITPTNVATFYSIASSNLTGVSVQYAGPYPELMPLDNVWSFLIVN